MCHNSEITVAQMTSLDPTSGRNFPSTKTCGTGSLPHNVEHSLFLIESWFSTEPKTPSVPKSYFYNSGVDIFDPDELSPTHQTTDRATLNNKLFAVIGTDG